MSDYVPTYAVNLRRRTDAERADYFEQKMHEAMIQARAAEYESEALRWQAVAYVLANWWAQNTRTKYNPDTAIKAALDTVARIGVGGAMRQQWIDEPK